MQGRPQEANQRLKTPAVQRHPQEHNTATLWQLHPTRVCVVSPALVRMFESVKINSVVHFFFF